MTAPLLPDECRVLGVLVEKAQTTPGQYPLSLNGVVVGSAQKNNRDPVFEMDEDRAAAALDGLRAKGLVRELSMEGSRVAKYRHIAREGLEVDTTQLVLLTELLLRGPQTVGELRGRASRMHPLESIEIVQSVLQALADRPDPLAKEIAPAPGSRAPRWMQLLCPALHRIDRAAGDGAAGGDGSAAAAAGAPAETGASTEGAMAARVAELESRLGQLEARFEARWATVAAALRELGVESP